MRKGRTITVSVLLILGITWNQSIKTTEDIQTTSSLQITSELLDENIKKQVAGLSYRSARHEAIEIIKASEGFKAKPYICPSGTITIGYGLTGKYIKGRTTITEAEASQELKYIYDDMHEFIRESLGRRLPENQMAALVSLMFNIGETQFLKSTLFQKLKDGSDASSEFSKWVYADGKRLKGLEIRRNKETELFIAQYK